jgi:copper chaperone
MRRSIQVIRRFEPRERKALMTKIKIDGMSCNHCVMAVTKALGTVPGVERVVEVSLDRGEAVVEGSADVEQLVAVIREEGYEAEPIG